MCRECGKTFRHPTAQEVVIRSHLGHLDIEASQLKADFGHLYSWCILDHDGVTMYGSMLKERSLEAEKDILESLVFAMEKFDVLATYNGTRFDIPFIRTRCLYHGVAFPEYGTIYHRDIYFVARSRVLTHSRRLETVSRFLGIPGKTPLEPEIWVKASFGDKKAMHYIYEHNQEDVKVLRKVYLALEPYMKPTWRGL